MSKENEMHEIDTPPAECERSGIQSGEAGCCLSSAHRSLPLVTEGESANEIGGSEADPQRNSPCCDAQEQLKFSEGRLQHYQKMEALSTLTGGIAHDFNNLLTAIIGNTQLALYKVEGDDSLRHRLQEIEKATNRATTLVRQLLAFSRRQTLERRSANVNEIILGIIKLLERIIGEDIEISTQCAADLAPIWADPAQIEQVLVNLCVNAREAISHGGTINIETKNFTVDENLRREISSLQPGNYVQICISDSGKGIDEKTKARVFDPYFTTKDVGNGSGLGLSTAYGIVQQHDGHIDILSEAGQGTCVRVFLPFEKTSSAQEENTRPSLPGGNETILVAEDEESLRSLAKDVLEKAGYTVLLVKNGEEAIEVYTENRERIDLLLFDLVMPRMGGVEAYKHIKQKTGSGKKLPVIFMTGYNNETVHNRFVINENALEKLGAAVIQKPYEVPQLRSKIREVLDSLHKKKRRSSVEEGKPERHEA